MYFFVFFLQLYIYTAKKINMRIVLTIDNIASILSIL